MILLTWSHIYIDWGLLIAQVADVIIVFIKITDGISGVWNGLSNLFDLFLLVKTDNILIVYLIE